MNYKTILKFSLKIFGLVFIMYYLAFEINWNLVSWTYISSRKKMLVFAFLFFCLKLLFDAWKWLLVNRVYGLDIRFTALLKFLLTGVAVGFIYPVPQGENLYCFYILKKRSASVSKALSILILLRLTGVMALLLILPFSVWFYYNNIQLNGKSMALTGFFAVGFGLLFFYLKTYFLFKRNKLGTFFRELVRQLLFMKHNLLSFPSRIIFILLINLLSIGCYALFVWNISLVFFDISLMQVFLFIPVVYLGVLIPFVPGIAVREGLWVGMFVMLNFNYEKALVFGILHLLFHLLFIVLGFFLYLFNQNEKKGYEKDLAGNL